VTPPLLCPPCCITHIPTTKNHKEQDDLEQEPGPATTGAILLSARLAWFRVLLTIRARLHCISLATLGIIEVLGGNHDDVVVITQLARLGRETEVRNAGNSGRLVGLEAELPGVFSFVLKLELQALILEVGETGFGRYACAPDAPGRTTHELIVLAVVGLVVDLVAISNHSHDIGEYGAWTIVFVGVEEDSETFEFVDAAEDGPRGCTLLGEPHCEAIAVQVPLSVDFEFYFNLS
jgi:hypothetical protein